VSIAVQMSLTTPSAAAAGPSRVSETLVVDFVQLANAPYVQQVLGCIDQFFATSGLRDEPEMTVSSVLEIHYVSAPLPTRLDSSLKHRHHHARIACGSCRWLNLLS
jgi:hypothetical protein